MEEIDTPNPTSWSLYKSSDQIENPMADLDQYIIIRQ